ncbi:nestin [Terrapene carolina triunguis]|uniref:nestin n=1 Tax=Terrapene triunguis TaxID=2587831 RepID=UPI000E77EB08|nr:nestin [Terrapene carolina triunguis]
MEGFLAARALGEESLQMWDLNKRLEAYLARVKFLEEENELLRAEIQSAKDRPAESSWRCKYEEELSALRATLDDAFREKHAAELTRDNLSEEIQHVKSRCQKERAAQEEAKKQLALSKKELEEERRAQIWLRERATQLEKEVEVLVDIHEEEKAGLEQEMASFSQSLENFRAVPVAFQPVEVEDYSKRLSEIWRGAVETYKSEVSQLESSLCQAKENLWKAVEGNRQNQLHLQQLEKELAGLKARKGMLEESLSRQWQDQRGEAEKFQLALESLEQEKEALGVQIAHVLEERQQLMHLKMSLGLEVATYRTLLEAESSRLQMPSAEYKLVNGFRDAKLEVSNSKLQAVTPESRRLVSWDHRLSPTTFQKGESKTQLLRNQIDSPKLQAAAVLPKSDGPVAREFQKINSVLQSPLLKSAQAVRDTAAPGHSIPVTLGSSHAGEMIKAAEAEMVAHSFSREPFEQLDSMRSAVPEPRPLGRSDPDTERRSPAAEGGDPPASQVEAGDFGQEEECHEEARKEVEKDPSEEPPGKLAPKDSLCPRQLVNEALEDALKEVIDRSEPAVDSGPLQADKAPNYVHSYVSAPLEEAYGLAASPSAEVLEEGKETEYEGQMEASHPAEQLKAVKGIEATDEMDSGLEPRFEEETREAAIQELPDVKRSAQQGGEESQSGLGPSTKRNEESIPDILATEGRPEIETREEVRSWKQNESQEEETPRSQSADMCGETDAVCKSTERGSPLDEGGLVLTGAEGKSWEAGISGHSHLPATEGNVEEFDRGEEDLEVVSTEALNLSEDEERQELWSPSRENEEDNFQAEMLESEFLQAEIQATQAFPMESHPALVVESPQEEHLSGAEQEKFEQQEMSLHETDAAVGEDGRKEMFSDRELLSIKQAIFGDETVSKAEENILGDETLDRTRGDSEEHKAKLEEETLGREDLSADENGLRHENLKQEKDTLEEEVGDLQENGFEQDIMLANEGLENVQKLESLGREEEVEEDHQRHLPKEKEGEGKEDAEGYSEIGEAADIALQEPAWADTMTSTGVTENEREQIKGSWGAEMEEIMGDDDEDDDAGHFIGSEHPMSHNEAEQEASPGTELMEEDHYSSEREHEAIQSQPAPQLGDSPSHEISDEQTEVLEEPWEKVDVAGEAEGELCEEPKRLENIDMASQAPGDFSESEDSLGSLEDVSPNASQKMEGMEEEELESGKRIMLEETLPDSTPLRFYEKEVLAEAMSNQPPPVSDDGGDSPPAPESTAVSPDDVGQLESRVAPSSSQEKESNEEDESGPVLARTSERAEEEGGYFMVSAPSQETPCLEEAEVLEDFEEIKVETSNLTGEDPEMLLALSEVPRDESLFEAESEEEVEQESNAGKESEGREFPPEESKPHCSDFTWEPEKEDGFPSKASDCGSIAGGAQTESDGTLDAPEPGDVHPEDARKVSPLTSTAELGEILLEGQLPLSQKGSPDSSSPLSSEDESPNVTQSHPGSDPEVSGGLHPGQPKDATEMNQSGMDHSMETVAKIPADVMKDSDILEIVEQALEFNQELMLGARLSELHAGDEQQAQGRIDVSDQTQEVGRDGGMSETGALQETVLDSSPQSKELTTSSHVWTESNANGEMNGLHGEQILNGISDLQPLTDQNDCAKSRGHEVSSSGDEFFGKVTITQELHGEEPEAFPILETMLSQSPLQTPDYEEGHGAGEEHSKKGQVSDETDKSKFADIMQSAHMQRQDLEAQTISVPSPFGDDVFHLGPSQHLKFQLKDDQESWSSEDD